MEIHLKFLSNNDLLEKHLLSTCEYFCRMCNSQSKSSTSERELSWMAIAKLIRNCKGDMLKKISSRIQKRIVDSLLQPLTIGIVHFTCAVLEAYPNLKRFNKEGLSKIMTRLIDFAVMSEQPDLITIVSYAFSLYADESTEEMLLSLSHQVLTGNFDPELLAKSSLKFESCLHRANRDKFISMVFEINSILLESHLTAFVVSLDQWLHIASLALAQGSQKLKDAVFEWIERVISHGGLNVAPFGKRIMSLFMDFSSPSTSFYNAFRRFYLSIGPSSRTTSVLCFLLKTPVQPWWEQVYAEAYAKAVYSVLTSKVYFLKPPELINFQRMIGLDAFTNPKSRLILRLFIALLSLDHELIPCPIQLAQSIFAAPFDSADDYDEFQLGRALCACISRPKAHLVLHFEKWIRKMDDIIVTLKGGDTVVTVVTASNFAEDSKRLSIDEITRQNSSNTVDASLMEEGSKEPKRSLKPICEMRPEIEGIRRNQEPYLPQKDTSDKCVAASKTFDEMCTAVLDTNNGFATTNQKESEENTGPEISGTLHSSSTGQKPKSIPPSTSDDKKAVAKVGEINSIPGKSSLTKYDDAPNETAAGKRKLINIWGDSSSENVMSPKRDRVDADQRSGTVASLEDGNVELLTPEQMMEDLYID